ncbi:uncharacterized [Tachysurus ichikawai]
MSERKQRWWKRALTRLMTLFNMANMLLFCSAGSHIWLALLSADKRSLVRPRLPIDTTGYRSVLRDTEQDNCDSKRKRKRR